MENANSSIYVQAKIEYTKQLINYLQNHFFDGVKSIYDDSKDLYKENSSSSQLFIFRTLLEKVPEWNNELIVTETDRIIEVSKCDYLEDLLTAVFISHTKILMSISNNTDKINLTVPKLSNFIHKCYINIARDLWKNPLLFSENISGLEYQKNLKTIETIIYDCIENTIRFSLPVKDILKGQLEMYDSKEEKVDKEDDNTLLLNKLKELLNLQESPNVEGNSEEDKEDEKEDIEDTNVKKEITLPVIEITKEVDTPLVESNEPEITSGYDSPGEETIDQNCKNLDINDIDEVIVDKNVYDNVDIISESQKDNNEVYEKLVKIKQDNEEQDTKSDEVIVSKLDNTINDKKDEVITIPDEPILSTDEMLKKEQEERKYDKIIDITDSDKKEQEEKDKKVNNDEIIVIDDSVITGKPSNTISGKKEDDNETVDLFFDDLKSMSDKKGLTLDKVDESKYTLFDDLS
jgi:hypothetical protein